MRKESVINEDFVKKLNDLLMEYHNEVVVSMRGYINDFKSIFIDLIKSNLHNNSHFYNKSAFETILKGIENNLNPTFQVSILKMTEKYTLMCEKAYQKLIKEFTSDEEGFQKLKKDMASLIGNQIGLSKQVCSYTETVAEVQRNFEEKRINQIKKEEKTTEIRLFASKLLKQQKLMRENFKILSEKVELLEEGFEGGEMKKSGVGQVLEEQNSSMFYPKERPQPVYQQPPIVVYNQYKKDDGFSQRNSVSHPPPGSFYAPPPSFGYPYQQMMPSYIPMQNEFGEKNQEIRSDKNQFQNFES